MARVPADQRRRQIVDATIQVVAKHGVRGATTREIAAEAGAPLAAVHYCFSSKDELLAEVYATQTRSLVEGLPPTAHREGMAAAAIHIVETSAERCIRHREWSLSNAEIEFWAQRHEERRGIAGANSYDVYNGRVTEILVAACRGDDDPTLAEPLSGLLAVIVDGLNFQWFVYRDVGRFRSDVRRASGMIDRYDVALRGQRDDPRPSPTRVAS